MEIHSGCDHDFFGSGGWWGFTNETKIFSLFLFSFYMLLCFLVLGFFIRSVMSNCI